MGGRATCNARSPMLKALGGRWDLEAVIYLKTVQAANAPQRWYTWVPALPPLGRGTADCAAALLPPP